MARLRAPGGCPWDAEQTHESLKRHLLEECYEALEAIDNKSPMELAEELGDILVQVAFHADIAQQAGTFEIADVVTAINRKLIRRHPHVFADGSAIDARQVERNWEQLKAMERREAGKLEPSAMDSVPEALPALTAAQLIQDRSARFGFDWDEVGGVLDKIVEEIGEFRAAATETERTAEFGDILFALVNLARWSGGARRGCPATVQRAFSRPVPRDGANGARTGTGTLPRCRWTIKRRCGRKPSAPRRKPPTNYRRLPLKRGRGNRVPGNRCHPWPGRPAQPAPPIADWSVRMA